MTSNYEAALDWKKRGYNPVPLAAGSKKRPGVGWISATDAHGHAEPVLARREPMFANGVGFITGAISGVVVIETDLLGRAGLCFIRLSSKHGALPETFSGILSESERGFHPGFSNPGWKVKTVGNLRGPDLG